MSIAEWNRAVPHIGGKQKQPPYSRLNGTPHGQPDVEGRFPKFNPTLVSSLIINRLWQVYIVAGTDPAARMQMVYVVATIAKP